MAGWVILLRGLLSEIAAVQSWLNANRIPTLVRNADMHGSLMELLVPTDKVAVAKELLAALMPLPTEEHEDHRGGEWDE